MLSSMQKTPIPKLAEITEADKKMRRENDVKTVKDTGKDISA